MKFRQVATKSRFHDFAVNKPKRNEPQLLSSKQETMESLKSFKLMSPTCNDSFRNSCRRSNLVRVTKADLANRQMSKQTIRKMKRFQTEPVSTSSGKNIIRLKQYIRSITKTCNSIEKRYTYQEKDESEKRQQNKRFMLRHLSFFEIDEDKINEHREYLDKMKQGHLSSSKMTSAKLIEMGSKKEEKLMQSFKAVDKIYSVLHEMDQLGYTLKNNKYVINFCTDRKIWLIPIFLHQSKDKKDAFSVKTKWIVHSSSSECKSKLSNFIASSKKLDFAIILNGLDELLDHIESALAHKKVQEISNVQGYVENRMKKRKQQGNLGLDELRITKYNHQNFDFCKSLIQIEEKYGPMREITKVSRCRFEDLNKTYEKLHAML